MQNLNQFKDLLSTSRKCVIVMHTKPDADALGSSLGLAGYLLKKDHDVTVISPCLVITYLSPESVDSAIIPFSVR